MSTAHLGMEGMRSVLEQRTFILISHVLNSLVDDDLEVHAVVLHDALDGAEVDPQVVGVCRDGRGQQVPGGEKKKEESGNVLKILNLRTDLKSSTWSLGTWAISSNRTLPS